MARRKVNHYLVSRLRPRNFRLIELTQIGLSDKEIEAKVTELVKADV